MKAKKGDYILVEHRSSWTGANYSSGGASVSFRMDRAKKVNRDGRVVAGERSGPISAQQKVAIVPPHEVGQYVIMAYEKFLSFSSLMVARRVFTDMFGLIVDAKPFATIDDDDILNIDRNPHSGNMVGGYGREQERQGRTFTPTVGTTLREAQAQVSALGFTLKKRDGEYIVTKKGEREGYASYYTNDVNDAVATAHRMHIHSLGRFTP